MRSIIDSLYDCLSLSLLDIQIIPLTFRYSFEPRRQVPTGFKFSEKISKNTVLKNVGFSLSCHI